MADADPTAPSKDASGAAPPHGASGGARPPVGSARPVLQALLRPARRRLVGAALLEAATAAGTGALIALLVALVIVGLAPFSLALRVGLWALLGVTALGGLVLLVARRLLPLRHDLVVAARLEDGARRNGVELSDAVRGAVELADTERDHALGRSRALCDAHVHATVERVARAGALTSLPAVALGLALPTLLALTAALLVFGAWWVAQPASLQTRWSKLFDDAVAEAAVAERQASLLPLVTDLKITLRFPQYMAEPDQITAGSSGDIVAPRGTEVVLDGRADRAVRAAALLVGEREVALTVTGERQLVGRFVVDQAGAYRFRLAPVRGADVLDPVAHKITVKPDDVPTVELEAPLEDQVVQIDDVVKLAFAGKDDYGITKFRVVVRRPGIESPYVHDLMDVGAAPRELRGKGELSIGDTGARPGEKLSVYVEALDNDTGARPGEKLSVYVEALDNDTVTGPKAGRSQTRVLTVFSAAEQHRKLIERMADLLGKMVESLGDELESPVPETPPPDGAKLMTVHAGIHEREAAMFQALDDALAILRDDALAPQPLRRAMANMKNELRPPYASKKDTVDAAKRTSALGRELLPYVFRRVAAEQRILVDKLESSALYLEDLVNQQRIAEARQIADDMKRTQQDLKELLEKYKADGDPKTREALMARIQELKAQMQSLMQRLAELQRQISDEHMNEEAFKDREMMQGAQDLDRLIEEGKLDEALKQLDQMVDGTQKMLEQLDETGEQFAGDDYKELKEKLQRFQQDLESLKQAQEEQMKKSEQLLEGARKEAEKRLAGKLEKLLADLQQKTKAASKHLAGIDQDGLFTMEQEDAAFAEARTADLLKALEEGDLEDALMSADQAENAAKSVERALADRTRGKFGARQKATMAAKDKIASARPLLEEVREELEGVLPDPSQMLDKAQRAQMGKDADRQRQLEEGVQKLQQMMAEMGKEAPIFGPSHKQRLDEAAGSMRQAGKDLDRQNLRQARGSQQQAARALGELQQAMEEMGKDQQGGPGGGVPMPLPGGQGDDGAQEGGRGQKSREDVKIPDGSEFRVPDAFRKDILDAMKENAPQEWMGEVKRYYEELVK